MIKYLWNKYLHVSYLVGYEVATKIVVPVMEKTLTDKRSDWLSDHFDPYLKKSENLIEKIFSIR